MVEVDEVVNYVDDFLAVNLRQWDEFINLVLLCVDVAERLLNVLEHLQ